MGTGHRPDGCVAERAVAVLDIGKTNAKLCVVSPVDGAILASTAQAFAGCPGPPYRHLDAEGLWAWVQGALAGLAKSFEIGTVVVAAHGATCALVDDTDLVLPILDYEDSGPDDCEADYARWRPPFAETQSPSLPGSLNFGKGIFWLARDFPAQFARVRHILNYAQYWSWRLSGVAANEVCSIGSHSDLWNPRAGTFSSLAGRRGWAGLFPPMCRADAVLGTLRQEVVAATGLPADCAVLCGIHDSNASLVPWLDLPLPFTVVSTGTWVINLSVGADLDLLDPQRDCAANVSMHGDAIASSRWMGGREYANLAGDALGCPTLAEVSQCLADATMFLPPQGGQGGPFPGPARSSPPGGGLAPGVRTAAASLYCALMLDVCLDLCASTGLVIVEGPLACNQLALQALAHWRSGQDILVSDDPTGTTAGAARLALPHLPPPTTLPVLAHAEGGLLDGYRNEWRAGT